MENKGIKETKEAVAGAFLLGVFLYKKFADGVQASDAFDIFSKFQGDTEFNKMITAAYNGAELVPAELADLSFAEGIELGTFALNEVSKAVVALKA